MEGPHGGEGFDGRGPYQVRSVLIVSVQSSVPTVAVDRDAGDHLAGVY